MTTLPIPLMITFLLGPTTALALISNHWMLAWVGLELSMMVTLLLLQKPKTTRSNEATIKYFITQTIASTMILAAAVINFSYTGTWNITQLENKFAATLAIISLALKMGAAPVHFWLPEVLQGSPLHAVLIITTWQKIAPTALMFMLWKNGHSETLITIGLLSILVGGFGAINHTHMRKLIAYSSINSTGWTLTMMAFNSHLALLNMIIYINLILIIMYIMEKIPMKTLQNWTTLCLRAQIMGFLAALAAFATSGLPPTSGWAPKMMIADEMLEEYHLAAVPIAMTTMSLITLLFYIRMAYISSMTSSPSTSNTSTKWRPIEHTSLWLSVLTAGILTAFLLLPALAAH